MESRGEEEGQRTLLLSIPIVLNVCRAVQPLLSLEPPEIIKESEDPAKNPQSLADIRTYHSASGKAGTI